MDVPFKRKPETAKKIVTNILNNGLSIIKEDVIAEETEKIVDLKESILKKIYNICIEKSNLKSELNSLNKYLSFMEAISKVIRKNFTIDDILEKLHDLPMTLPSIVTK